LLVVYRWVLPGGAPWEHMLLLRLHAALPPTWMTAAEAVSLFGYPRPIIIVGLGLAFLWWRRGPVWKAGTLVVTLIALAVLNYGGKPFFARARPELFPHADVAGFAYPSGHALFAVGFYGLVADLLLREADAPVRIAGWTVWALFAVATGGSRLALGLHWPTDVLAGYLAGALVLLAVVRASRPWRASGAGGTSRSDLVRWR
ncbi:MAG: phosphatase PAP2 family protein, partial [Clostridia bacterium]|nr:phosphatase PAP2 family protein [Clostridia bacterium]